MLKKLYDTSSIWFAVVWIIAYCVLMSLADSFSVMLDIEKSLTLVVGLVLCVALFAFLKKNGLLKTYGFCFPKASAGSMLYYLPVFGMLSANLWYGFTSNDGVLETALYILSMFCVGFLEEVIFRGLLFEAMRKDSLKVAVIVSSVTFGIGHIINLINGSGAELLPNLLQVIYATTAGFMFVMMYLKAESLLPCTIAHGIFNALSVFSNEANATQTMRIMTAIFLTVITSGYGIYIAMTMRKKENCNECFGDDCQEKIYKSLQTGVDSGAGVEADPESRHGCAGSHGEI